MLVLALALVVLALEQEVLVLEQEGLVLALAEQEALEVLVQGEEDQDEEDEVLSCRLGC